MIKNYERYASDTFDIIVLAGQSNAFGFGLGKVKDEYKPSTDILLLQDEHNVDYIKTDDGLEILDVKNPTDYFIKIAEEQQNSQGKIGCFALYFAKKYKSECLKNGRKIIIVKAAVGGTGFVKGQWTTDGCLYNRMIDMIDSLLALNNGNRIVSFLWHQGECDAFENEGKDPQVIEREYYINFGNFIKQIYAKYGKIPFIAGAFTEEWSQKYLQESNAVISATKKVLQEYGCGGFIYSNGLKSNNQVLLNGDDIHFSRASLYELGERYYAEFSNLKAL